MLCFSPEQPALPFVPVPVGCPGHGYSTHLRQYRCWQNTAPLLLPQNTKPPSPARGPSSRSRSGVANNYPESTRLQSPRAGVPQAGLPTPSFPGERTGVAGSPAESTLQSQGASTALGSLLRYLIQRRVLIEEQGETQAWTKPSGGSGVLALWQNPGFTPWAVPPFSHLFHPVCCRWV